MTLFLLSPLRAMSCLCFRIHDVPACVLKSAVASVTLCVRETLQRVGFVTADMIKEVMFPPSPDLLIVLCGPPPMCRAVKRALAADGYSDAMVYSYM